MSYFGYSADSELKNVPIITTPPADADVLIYNTNKWESAPQTSLNAFSGATPLFDGEKGVVPKPEAGQQQDLLRGDGQWLKNTVQEVDPTTTDDELAGFSIGSRWVNSTNESVKMFTLTKQLGGTATWLMQPVCVFAMYAVCICSNTSRPQDLTNYINLEYLGRTGGTSGLRSFENAVVKTESYPNLVTDDGSAYRIHDPFACLDNINLNIFDRLGEGWYQIQASVFHTSDNAAARFSSNTLAQTDVGDLSIGIQVGVADTNPINNRYQSNIEWGNLDTPSVLPDSATYSNMVYIKTNPLRFVLGANILNSEEFFFRFSILKYS